MTAAAQQTVFVIRHAEKEATGTDPALTPEGRNRAADWAVMLRSVGLDVVITSDARRTRETGGLIAEALGLPIKQLPRNDVTGHVDLLDFDHSEEIALIVAHTETIPLLLGALGVEESIDVDKNAFDNLFIVSARMTDHPVLTHLRMP